MILHLFCYSLIYVWNCIVYTVRTGQKRAFLTKVTLQNWPTAIGCSAIWRMLEQGPLISIITKYSVSPKKCPSDWALNNFNIKELLSIPYAYFESPHNTAILVKISNVSLHWFWIHRLFCKSSHFWPIPSLMKRNTLQKCHSLFCASLLFQFNNSDVHAFVFKEQCHILLAMSLD